MWLPMTETAMAQEGIRSSNRCRAGAEMASRLDQTLSVDEFRIRYALQGPDALADTSDADRNGVPEAIDNMVTQLRAARTLYTETLGLRHPLQQPRYGLASAIDVFVVAMDRANGLAFDEVSYEKLPDGRQAASCAVSIFVSSRIQSNRNVTPAHELFHLFQYGYAMFKSRWYLEGMTRWMETAFIGDEVVNRDAERGGRARCEEATGSGPSSSPYWRTLAQTKAGPVVLPNDLSTRTYTDGRRVFARSIFQGGTFARIALDELHRLSLETAVVTSLPAYNWPESVQRSNRFDAMICASMSNIASRQ